jgi:hypothetical protein
MVAKRQVLQMMGDVLAGCDFFAAASHDQS